MPYPGEPTRNPELAQEISQNQAFRNIANEVQFERERQAISWQYAYSLSGNITGQQTQIFNITIEQGTDFQSKWLTASFFSYHAENATDFPIPNSLGVTAWAGRGLSIKITDTTSGRELTSGFIAAELLGTPGYGLNFQNPYPWRYFFYRNTKIRFDIRNRDNSNRVHYFEFALTGYKILTPMGTPGI